MTTPHARPRLRTPIAALVLSTVVATGCGGEKEALAARDAPPERTVERLERIVRERVDSGRSAGIVAGMVLPDGSTRVVAYGDAGRGRRLKARSVLEIGSITKVFTATLLAEVASRGEVKLTDPVASLLPPGTTVPSRGGRQITLEDLATQTSGLPSLPADLQPADPRNPYADYTVDRLYGFLGSFKLTRDPGSRYEYSNVGVGLLGHALALRAGKSYDELVRERILDPLRMRRTGIALTPAMARDFASGHDAGGRVVPPWDLPTLAGAGALRSSVADMLAFAKANLGDGPLGKAMAAARRPRHRIDAQMQIGLNWHILRSGGRDIVWHNGGTGGFSSFIGLDAARDTAIVVLSNSSGAGVDDIGFHLLDRRLPLAPAPAERKEITLPAAVLERYVGVYDLAGVEVTVTRSGRRLSVRAAGQGTERLHAETRTRFFLKTVDAQVTFELDSKGQATGLVLRQDGQLTRAVRLDRPR